jgi:RNA-binding protein
MEELGGKQRRYLRGQGNTIKPTVHLGKEGISKALLHALTEAFSNQELIKVRIEKGCSLERKDAAAQLAKAADVHLVQVLGSTLLLYRADPDEPKIKLSE